MNCHKLIKWEKDAIIVSYLEALQKKGLSFSKKKVQNCNNIKSVNSLDKRNSTYEQKKLYHKNRQENPCSTGLILTSEKDCYYFKNSSYCDIECSFQCIEEGTIKNNDIFLNSN